MADTAVTGGNVVYLSKNADVAKAAGQSVTTGNTAVLTPSGVNTPFKGRYMLVELVPTANSTVTFKAGVTGQTPANLAASGDLVVTLTGTTAKVIQIELARFLQAGVNGVSTVRADVGGTGPVAFAVYNLSKAA